MVALTSDVGSDDRTTSLDDAAIAQAPWLAEAQLLLASRDEIGPLDTRGALRLLDAVDRRVPLGLPWCGLFVGHCLRKALPDVPLPRLHARARPWLSWGRPVEPGRGAILVFWHVHPRSPLGHVSFYLSEDADTYEIIGGNQHDRIAIERRPKDRLLGTRWPEGAPAPRDRDQARSA